tara:strand:- start:841 stop:1005 length:165 start_codon:yes stop_codon:yes gene_type:complete
MPNSRDPDKRRLQAWMYEKDINVLRSVAKEKGITLTDLLVDLANELKKRNKKQK